MNFGTMINTVYRLSRDNLNTKYDRESIKRWINEGERRYCTETGFSVQKDETVITQSGVTEYNLPSDCNSVIAVFLDRKPLNICNIEDTIDEVEQTGIPLNFYIRNKKIGLYPQPTAAHYLMIIYRSIGGSMVENADEPIIPVEHHYIPVWWATYLCTVEGDDTRSKDFLNLFIRDMAAAGIDVVNKNYPPVTTGVVGEEYNHDFNRIG